MEEKEEEDEKCNKIVEGEGNLLRRRENCGEGAGK